MKTLNIIIFLSLLIKLSVDASYYDLGKKSYYEKDYTNAINYFKKAKEEYSNTEMQLLWADSEKKLGRSGHLISAYERILNIDPGNFEVTYKLIQLYKKLGLKKEIKKVILNFDYNNYPPSTRSYLAQGFTTDYLNVNKFSARFACETGYDSAININSYKDSIENKTDKPLSTNKGSSYSKQILNTSYTHDIVDKGDLFLNIDFDLIKKTNFKESLYDLQNIKATSALGYKINNTIISIPIYYETTSYLRKDFTRGIGFKPTISILFDSYVKLDFSYKSEQIRYIQNDMDIYDYNSYELSSGLNFRFAKNYLLATVSYSENVSANKNNNLLKPRYINSSIYTLSLNSIFNMKDNYMLNLNYNLRIMDSSVENYLDNKRIGDNFNDITFGFGKNISPALKIMAKIDYYTNLTIFYKSNYDKLMSSIYLEYNF